MKKIVIIGLLLLLIYISSINQTTYSNLNFNNSDFDNNNKTIIATDVYFYHVPVQINNFAVGIVGTGRGFAYIQSGSLYFRDIIQGLINSMNIGGDPIESTLIGVDIDNDSRTEFLIVTQTPTLNITIIDFDEAAPSRIMLTVENPKEIIYGDFNADGYNDITVYNDTHIQMIDIHNNSTFGTYSLATGKITRCIAADFNPSYTGDEIIIYTNTASIIEIDESGSLITNKINAYTAYDIEAIRYGNDSYYDVIITAQNKVEIYNGTNMASILSQSYQYVGEINYLGVGNFTNDEQTDFIIIPDTTGPILFFNGTNGYYLFNSSKDAIISNGHRSFSMALIDADNKTDVVIQSPNIQAAFYRGVNGNLGYEEPQDVGPFLQISTFDMNGDGHEDIVTLNEQSEIRIVKSDTTAPIIDPEPIYPQHPTIKDLYVKFEIKSTDDSRIDSAKVYIKRSDDSMYESHDMVAGSTNGFILFLTGLDSGSYDFYYEVTDAYLNTITSGNASTPLTFSVAGHFSWTYNLPTSTNILKQHIVDTIDNISSNDKKVIALYSRELATNNTVGFSIFSPQGDILYEKDVVNSSDLKVALYSAWLDSDNVKDFVIFDRLSDEVILFVFHGSNATSIDNISVPIDTTYIDNFPVVIADTNNDGYDEIYFVGESDEDNYYLVQINHDLTYSTFDLINSTNYVIDMEAVNLFGTDKQIAVLRLNQSIQVIYNNMTIAKSYNYSSPELTAGDNPLGLAVFHNASKSTEDLLAYYSGYNNGYRTYFCWINSQTSYIGEISGIKYGGYAKRVFTYDTNNDGIDEIIELDTDRNITLMTMKNYLMQNWTKTAYSGELQFASIFDYDGDGTPEIVFTSSDSKVHMYNFTGYSEYNYEVANIYGGVIAGNADISKGEDFFAYPIIGNLRYSSGMVRDIDSLYLLNVSIDFSETVVDQGSSIIVDTEVVNVYNEDVTDARVTIVAKYTGGQQIYGLVYNETAGVYEGNIATNWPMGKVNITLEVEHTYYTNYYTLYPDKITVLSNLYLTVFSSSYVVQGNTFWANVTITDNLGQQVVDANVSLTMNGQMYYSTYNGHMYDISVQNITLNPGEHNFVINATHEYAVSPVNYTDTFDVYTTELKISLDSPNIVDQFDDFQVELNITDPYGHLIDNATVFITISGNDYYLNKISPGVYRINMSADLSIGNHTCEIHVEHDYIINSNFGNFYMIVKGNITTNVQYPERAQGGKTFNVTIYVSDVYDTPLDNPWVIININGVNYTATNISTTQFVANVPANFSIGTRYFQIYVGSQFGYTKVINETIDIYSVCNVTLSSSMGWSLTQNDITTLKIYLTDWTNMSVAGATILTLSPARYIFADFGNGTYLVDFSAIGYAPGNYSLLISIEQDNLISTQIQRNITIYGDAYVKVEMPPSIQNGINFTFTYILTDAYGNPIYNFDYNISFIHYNIFGKVTNNYRFNLTFYIDSPPGTIQMRIYMNGTYFTDVNSTIVVKVISDPVVNVISPIENYSLIQGNVVQFRLNLSDCLGHEISTASLKLYIHDNVYLLYSNGNGVYTANVSTSGWAAGTYKYTLKVEHRFLAPKDVSGQIKVIGIFQFDIMLSSKTPEQDSILNVSIRTVDIFGHPIKNATIIISFHGYNYSTKEIDTGVYVSSIPISQIPHGKYDIKIYASAELYVPSGTSTSIDVLVPPPKITMSTQTFTLGTGISFLISFIGMIIYFKFTRSFLVEEKNIEILKKGIRKLDILYVFILSVSTLGLVHSFVTASTGNYSLAVVESILLLGASLLLYGIWLYRDANSSILVNYKISRRRMILGMWHLIFVPLVIWQIFEWGNNIEWFQVYVLSQTFAIGEIQIPSIMLTIFATYISSIVLVVVNLYREISIVIKRLNKMISMGTPDAVIEDERINYLGRISSSIRIKFFMFLVVLGGTTVSTMDFLRSYSIGVIVLLPVLFLVVIPYISSKLAKIITRVQGIIGRRRSL